MLVDKFFVTISRIAKHNCSIILFPTYCIFQDLQARMRIDMSRQARMRIGMSRQQYGMYI